jgi:hypothetical protein
VDDQPDVASVTPVATFDHAFVEHDCVRPAITYISDGLCHVQQAIYLAHGKSMIHRDDNCTSGITVNYAFNTYVFSNHVLHLQQFQGFFSALLMMHNTCRGFHKPVRRPVLEGIPAY